MSEFEVFCIVWGSFAIISAMIAAFKRLPVFGWFFISLVLGPVGTLGVAMTPKRLSDAEKAAKRDAELKDVEDLVKKTKL